MIVDNYSFGFKEWGKQMDILAKDIPVFYFNGN